MRFILLRRTIVASVALLLTLSASAVAQNDEVHVDPESPAGKEYSLPVDQAKRSGATPSSGSEGAAQASDGAALFGAGVEPPTQPGPRSSDGDASRGTDDGSTAVSGLAGPDETRGRAAAAEPSGSALPWLIGWGIVILVAGIALSRAVRRAARPQP